MADYEKFRKKVLKSPAARSGYLQRAASLKAAEIARKIRSTAGISQEELAVRSGRTQEAISKLEAARSINGPLFSTLSVLAYACDLDMEVKLVKRKNDEELF